MFVHSIFHNVKISIIRTSLRIIVAIAIVFAMHGLWSGSAEAEQATTRVIQMTDQGLQPSQLTVEPGTTVFFVNTGKFTHWPASNNHPSHELYPELDARETVAPGATWSFTFEKIGEWKIHDHLNPQFEATIAVVESSDLDTQPSLNQDQSASDSWLSKLVSLFAQSPTPETGGPHKNLQSDQIQSTHSPTSPEFNCTGKDASNFECYKSYYMNKVLSDGIASAFDDAKRREKTNEYLLSMCHPIAHSIGHAAVKKFDSVNAAFKQGDGYCWSGYYHGVMEGMIARIGRENLPTEIGNICSSIPGKETYSFDYYNCIHGLGHGVMAVNGIELFDSLDICAKLDGSWEQSSCYGGVYMENVMVEQRGQHTKYLKREDSVYPCNAVKDQYKKDCFMMQTSYMLKVANGDFGKVFEQCSDVEQQFRKACYQSLGRDAASYSLNKIQPTISSCKLASSSEAKVNCIIGASKNFVSALHDDKRAISLCNATDAETKMRCLSAVKQYYQTF